jgi:hypothetical protein
VAAEYLAAPIRIGAAGGDYDVPGLHYLLTHIPAWAQGPVLIGVVIVCASWFIYQIVASWQRRQRTPKPKKRPEFEGPAVTGTARVLEWRGARFLSYELALRVEALGHQPYEVTVRQRVPIGVLYSRAAFRPNMIVAVQIDSTNPRNVWIDFKKGMYEEVYAEGPSSEDGRNVGIGRSPTRDSFGTDVSDEPAAPRRFVASDSRERRMDKEILICVTSDGLTVDKRPGDVFSLSDAMLGLWSPEFYGGTTMGTALHLRCENPAQGASRSYKARLSSLFEGDRHSFVLGGQDHRIGSRTRLQAQLKRHVDAWLWASDFDELLTVVSRRSGLDIRRPAPGEPIRCHLIPLDTGRERAPHWALDLGKDEMWVIDPYTNALIASAWCAQVTAIPAKYRDNGSENERGWTSPVLIMHVPGLQPLTIRPVTIRPPDWFWGLRHTRFSWRGKLPPAKHPSAVNMKGGPAYGVTDKDWLTLVEKFGLTQYLEEHDKQR